MKRRSAVLREFLINQNDAGQRIDRFLAKACPGLSSALLQKAIRTKNVKRNGRPAHAGDRLEVGDVVRIYLREDQFHPPAEDLAWKEIRHPHLEILYEDKNLLLLNKPRGMLTQPDAKETRETLSSHLKATLFLRGQWDPTKENSFAPALCNRIDRNTQGLVIAAKNAEALRIMESKIKKRELTKGYLCVIHGRIIPDVGILEHYLIKDSNKNSVRLYSTQVPGSVYTATRYRVLESCGPLSLVDCELITGRTHQIRAQFAAAGYPLLGDGKYGRERDNRPYGVSSQVLFSYRIRFDFPTNAGALEYLRGKTFSLGTDSFYHEFHTYAQKVTCR